MPMSFKNNKSKLYGLCVAAEKAFISPIYECVDPIRSSSESSSTVVVTTTDNWHKKLTNPLTLK